MGCVRLFPPCPGLAPLHARSRPPAEWGPSGQHSRCQAVGGGHGPCVGALQFEGHLQAAVEKASVQTRAGIGREGHVGRGFPSHKRLLAVWPWGP